MLSQNRTTRERHQITKRKKLLGKLVFGTVLEDVFIPFVLSNKILGFIHGVYCLPIMLRNVENDVCARAQQPMDDHADGVHDHGSQGGSFVKGFSTCYAAPGPSGS